MRIAASGFVSDRAGSVASANAMLLRGLLDAGHEVDFFSKSSFVDPRPAVRDRERFRFIEANNACADHFRAKFQRIPILGFLLGRWDCLTYVRLLIRLINVAHRSRKYDVVLWMGEYAPRRVANVPMVSFAQGPPGTDARSIVLRFAEIRKVAGLSAAIKWWTLAKLRLSRLGLPKFQHSDHVIVGSEQSRKILQTLFDVPLTRTAALPYPIDLELFFPLSGERRSADTLRVLWLGRIIPRKRLDVFLKGLELVIRQGTDVQVTIVGDVGFVPGYDRLIKNFAYPKQLTWIRHVPREDVPSLMRQHDVLAQPSEEENFGSSVAEAQACGLPVIVGRTNGNAEYLCSRDVHLTNDSPQCFAAALTKIMNSRAMTTPDTAVAESRHLATETFSSERILSQFERLLSLAHSGSLTSHRE